MPNSTIVFLPGFLCDERLWTNQVREFSKNYNVQVVDFKKSFDLASMLSEISKIEADQFHLVGFSMGGYIAEDFAIRYPERILSLSLIAANIGTLPYFYQKARMEMTEVLKHARYKGMTEKELRFYLYPDSLSNKDITNTIIEMSRGFTSEMYVAHTEATFEREDVSHIIDQQTYPVLILGSENDKVVPASLLREVHQKIKRSKLVMLQKSGHYIPLEIPLNLNESLNNFFGKSGI